MGKNEKKRERKAQLRESKITRQAVHKDHCATHRLQENAAGSPQGPPRHAQVAGKRGRQSTRTTAPRTGKRKSAARSPQGPPRDAQKFEKHDVRKNAGNVFSSSNFVCQRTRRRAAGGGGHVGVGARCGARGRKHARGARRGSRMRQKYDRNRKKSTEIDRYRDTATQRQKRATTGIVPGRCLNLSRAEQIPRGPKNTYRVCLDEPLVSCKEIVLCPGEFPVSLDECPAMSGAV